MANKNRIKAVLFAFAYLLQSSSSQPGSELAFRFSYIESNEAPFIDSPISPNRGLLLDIAKEISKN